jgi:hypothetical protein
MGCGLWSGLIQAEIGWGEADLSEVFAPCQMQGAGLRGEAGALLHQVGDVL